MQYGTQLHIKSSSSIYMLVLDPLNPLLFHLQVWLNCTLYNPPNHPVRVMGDEMSDLWERTWLESGIEPAWRDYELRYGSAAAPAASAREATQSGPAHLEPKANDHQVGKYHIR